MDESDEISNYDIFDTWSIQQWGQIEMTTENSEDGASLIKFYFDRQSYEDPNQVEFTEDTFTLAFEDKIDDVILRDIAEIVDLVIDACKRVVVNNPNELNGADVQERIFNAILDKNFNVSSEIFGAQEA